MPNVRSLNLVAEIPLLTTFQDPDTSKLVLVTTDTGGTPTAVEVDLIFFTLSGTNGNVRTWIGTISGGTWTINTTGGYPGMTANLAT